MRILSFEWDRDNVEHIARHAVNPHEAEEVCIDKPFIVRGRNDRHLIYGQTLSGRYLFLVIHYRGNNCAFVITAREMTETEKRLYHRKK